MTDDLPSVLLLAGGPDDEHPVSLESAACVETALRDAGAQVHKVVIDRPTLDDLRAMPGEVVFPALHGSFGEGGPLQDLLIALGRPFVGSHPVAARLAMDKLGAKLLASGLGVPTKPACVFNASDLACPLDLPVVVKPVHDGSSVGLHICRDQDAWQAAHADAGADIARRPGRAYLVESMVEGRECTVGLLASDDRWTTLPIVEIVPTGGVYDYDAKYERDDTSYLVDPPFSERLAQACRDGATKVAQAIGIRHLCRVDFLIDDQDNAWFMEVNTMPGFTTHSLFPMAARHAGVDMPELCDRLVRAAMQDFRPVKPIN